MKRTERTFAVFLKNDKEEWLMKVRKCADMSNSANTGVCLMDTERKL